AGNIDAAAILIAPGFDGNAVIAGAEGAVGDQDVAAAFRIAAIIVRPMTVDLDIAHGDVLTKHRVQLPHGRVPYSEVLEQDVLATVRLDEVRPEVVPFAEDAILHRRALIAHADQGVAIAMETGNSTLRAASGLAHPAPPIFVAGLSVQNALAC